MGPDEERDKKELQEEDSLEWEVTNERTVKWDKEQSEYLMARLRSVAATAGGDKDTGGA